MFKTNKALFAYLLILFTSRSTMAPYICDGQANPNRGILPLVKCTMRAPDGRPPVQCMSFLERRLADPNLVDKIREYADPKIYFWFDGNEVMFNSTDFYLNILDEFPKLGIYINPDIYLDIPLALNAEQSREEVEAEFRTMLNESLEVSNLQLISLALLLDLMTQDGRPLIPGSEIGDKVYKRNLIRTLLSGRLTCNKYILGVGIYGFDSTLNKYVEIKNNKMSVLYHQFRFSLLTSKHVPSGNYPICDMPIFGDLLHPLLERSIYTRSKIVDGQVMPILGNTSLPYHEDNKMRARQQCKYLLYNAVRSFSPRVSGTTSPYSSDDSYESDESYETCFIDPQNIIVPIRIGSGQNAVIHQIPISLKLSALWQDQSKILVRVLAKQQGRKQGRQARDRTRAAPDTVSDLMYFIPFTETVKEQLGCELDKIMNALLHPKPKRYRGPIVAYPSGDDYEEGELRAFCIDLAAAFLKERLRNNASIQLVFEPTNITGNLLEVTPTDMSTNYINLNQDTKLPPCVRGSAKLAHIEAIGRGIQVAVQTQIHRLPQDQYMVSFIFRGVSNDNFDTVIRARTNKQDGVKFETLMQAVYNALSRAGEGVKSAAVPYKNRIRQPRNDLED